MTILIVIDDRKIVVIINEIHRERLRQEKRKIESLS